MRDNYKIIKVMNNNVILANNFQNDNEAVLVGKGIGFGKKVNSVVKISKNEIEKMFITYDEKMKKDYFEIIDSIDNVIIETCSEIILKAEEVLGELNSRIHIVLTDHISFALERINMGLTIENPFLNEIKVLYKKEYELAVETRELLKKRMNIDIGKALMLPVAVLPIAALLLRLGASDVFDIPFMFAAGAAIFDNLAILFAIGIAIGLAKDNHGAAALAGAVSFFTLNAGAQAINADINMGVLSGIIAGLLASTLYNKYYDIELPSWLGFFGGKRFVSIITGLVSIVLALVLGYIWPPIQAGLDTFGNVMVTQGAFGAFTFGTLNRLLIPTGLHHILNSIFWFLFGEFGGVTGDLGRFFAGDPNAGVFMTGFYPVMMFGLPAAALAMYTTARKENKCGRFINFCYSISNFNRNN